MIEDKNKLEELKELYEQGNRLCKKVDDALRKLELSAKTIDIKVENISLLFVIEVPSGTPMQKFLDNSEKIEKELNFDEIQILAPITGTNYLGIRCFVSK